MTFENRSPVIFSSGSQRHSCPASCSSRNFTTEYVDSGRPGYSSSTGTYGGGVSNGSPSTVSLEAHTMFVIPACRAAVKTLYVVIMLLLNVALLVVRPGA